MFARRLTAHAIPQANPRTAKLKHIGASDGKVLVDEDLPVTVDEAPGGTSANPFEKPATVSETALTPSPDSYEGTTVVVPRSKVGNEVGFSYASVEMAMPTGP